MGEEEEYEEFEDLEDDLLWEEENVE